MLSKIAGGWQLNTFFSYSSGGLVTVTSQRQRRSTRLGTSTQFADKVKDGPVEVFGDVGPERAVFRRERLPRRSRQPRFGNSGHGEWRGPTAPNVDMSFFRVFRVGQNKTLQVRAEVFNVSNTPHFTQPEREHLERHVQRGWHDSRR